MTSKKEPTIDEYTRLKNELTRLILKKKEVDSRLAELEESIYEKETDYFNDSAYGNIVKGFDNFAKSSSGGSNKRRLVITDEDHIFSMSSATFVKTLLKRQGMVSTATDLDDYEDSVEPTNGGVLGKDAGAGTPTRKKKM
ncbi:NuA4-domain-containing protein [Metschnikowia bicuspidata var. bicuspidata NRRL YB-4993]|uniref:Chromatin modification-related protein EAF6 n=1 Tax=Metschnikowia bicuspidata var. bicuspidata NRRL YB-4993 TaxID=869754 RepID=A0A1A0HA23_9ASCO|nr:NuA4-domain-containing protein [Metschnikowia bicuspidata var. bicuspidata NRRL YB-4993]OBA20723.1 NuA4-domain-containing protein [Metschnikowia bicuspidata var. bicuspidata NRRL YB-4993]